MTRRLPLPTRRSFLSSSAGALALPLWTSGLPLPRGLRPRRYGPNERLRVASVGVGGMGGADLNSIASAPGVDVVALCDVDAQRLAAAVASVTRGENPPPAPKTFADYRRMFDAMADDIDAVSVSTPDHMHAPISLAAMRRGKHVYCQKPIAHDLKGCRAMAEMAAEKGLVTQMGTQIHAHSAYRTAVAALQQGVIGKVEEAHLWVSKSWAGPAAGRPDKTDPVPEHLKWDLWLGVAPERGYVNGIYHPAQWRGWKDFGCGTLGDMGCHIFDPVFTALGIGSPTKVVSRGPQHHAETFAADSDVTYRFPGTEHTAESIVFRWTDGRGQSRPAADRAQLPEGTNLPGAGSFLVGTEGVMVIPHWSMPQLYRKGEPLDRTFDVIESTNHYHEWVAACRGEGEASTPFAYSGPLTEAVLLGTIAGNFPETELTWDAEAMRLDHAPAQALVERQWRDGFGE